MAFVIGMLLLDYTGQNPTLVLDPETLTYYKRVFCSISVSCYFLH